MKKNQQIVRISSERNSVEKLKTPNQENNSNRNFHKKTKKSKI